MTTVQMSLAGRACFPGEEAGGNRDAEIGEGSGRRWDASEWREYAHLSLRAPSRAPIKESWRATGAPQRGDGGAIGIAQRGQCESVILAIRDDEPEKIAEGDLRMEQRNVRNFA